MEIKNNFTHDDFILMLRKAKERKRKWEESVGKKLDAIQKELDNKRQQLNPEVQ